MTNSDFVEILEYGQAVGGSIEHHATCDDCIPNLKIFCPRGLTYQRIISEQSPRITSIALTLTPSNNQPSNENKAS